MIAYGKGYRLSINENKITENGILGITSNPESAKITINKIIKGATNTNLTLRSGTYDIVLSKEGYQNWSKTINVKKDVVSRADAWLFPNNPSLFPLTSNGVRKVYTSDDSQKLIFLGTNDTDVPELGLYLYQNSPNKFVFGNGKKLIINISQLPYFDENSSKIIFSPIDESIIISYGNKPLLFRAYLVPTDGTVTLTDVSKSASTLISTWEKIRVERKVKFLTKLDSKLSKASLTYFKEFKVSPDANKIYYQAKVSGALPKIIEPELVGTNQTPQTRDLVAGNYYVYDIKEDKNFAINSESELFWYTSSIHLLGIEKGKSNNPVITIRDFDDSNHLTIYSSPFDGNFVSISPDGKLIILANLNPQINPLPELYQVGIR